MLESYGRSSSLWHSLEAELTLRLLHGDLVALGYALPRKPADAPAWIPRDVWTRPKLDLRSSSVTGGGLEFVSVRVLRPPPVAIDAAPADAALPPPAAPQRQRGRPSRRPEIEAAYQQLRDVTLVMRPSKIQPFLRTAPRWMTADRRPAAAGFFKASARDRSRL